MESLALQECLKAGTQGVAKRFFRAASRLIDTPWQIAVGSDLQNPRVEGKRTAQVRFVNWYIAKFFQAAQHDGALATKFLEVANLMQQPAALLNPGVALRVWKRNQLPVGAQFMSTETRGSGSGADPAVPRQLAEKAESE
jgi:hypothetical protein